MQERLMATRDTSTLTRRRFVGMLGMGIAGATLGLMPGCGGSAQEDRVVEEDSAATVAGSGVSDSADKAPAPGSSVALPIGAVCVAEYAGNTLAVIDPVSWQVIQRVPAGQNPATALWAAGSVYVGSSGGGEVAVVPADDLADSSHIPVGTQPLGLCYDEERGILYVGDYFSNSIHEVDVALNSLVGTIKLDVCGYHKRTDPPDCCKIGPGEGRRTVAMALAPEGDILYCANYGTYDVARIDLAAGKEIEAFDGVVGPRQMVVSHDGALLYLAGVGGEEEQQVNALYVLDRTTGKRVREVPVGQSVAGVAQSPDGAVAYALARDDGELVAFDAATWEELRRADVGVGADTLFLGADGETLYVANSSTGVLLAVDASTFEEAGCVEGLASPKGIAVVA